MFRRRLLRVSGLAPLESVAGCGSGKRWPPGPLASEVVSPWHEARGADWAGSGDAATEEGRRKGARERKRAGAEGTGGRSGAGGTDSYRSRRRGARGGRRDDAGFRADDGADSDFSSFSATSEGFSFSSSATGSCRAKSSNSFAKALRSLGFG